MNETLDGAERRFRRAESHLDSLRQEVDTFTQGDTYVSYTEDNLERVNEPYEVTWYIRVIRHPDPDLALLVGDAVQNFRISLEYLVWGLTVQNKGRSWAESRVPQIGFPVVRSGGAFDAARSRGLAGISQAVSDDIETLQPHKRSAGAESSDPLWHLRGLSNVDKHRLLHVVYANLQNAQFIVRPAVEGVDLIPSKSRRVEDGAKIASVVIPRNSLTSDVEIDGTLGLGLAIAKTTETEDLDMLVTLDAIRGRVRESINLLSHHLR